MCAEPRDRMCPRETETARAAAARGWTPRPGRAPGAAPARGPRAALAVWRMARAREPWPPDAAGRPRDRARREPERPGRSSRAAARRRGSFAPAVPVPRTRRNPAAYISLT